MNLLVNPGFMEYLQCPECSHNLNEASNSLICSNCQIEYEIRNGIPLMYPANIDMEHLEEEESLATKMKNREVISEEEFNLKQWSVSKKDFWDVVDKNLPTSPGLFVNIGCGYDSSFSKLEKRGHTFINFDMVSDMLESLQNDFGGKLGIAGDVNKMPFKREIFDVAISIDLIHHENEQDKLFTLLGSFHKLLKPGGTLILSDPNAWGIFQMAKSIFIPKSLYRFLRSTYHNIKKTEHRPADYEFPTNIWKVKGILRELGFHTIKAYPNSAYPTISEKSFNIYTLLSRFEYIRKYHNYHYILTAIKQ